VDNAASFNQRRISYQAPYQERRDSAQTKIKFQGVLAERTWTLPVCQAFNL
jgi:hypothetical protein